MSQLKNGVDFEALNATLNAIKLDPAKAKFKFRSKTHWLGGARSRTEIKDFALESDEPIPLLGSNIAPNAVEMVLAALGSCMSVGFAYSAAGMGINLQSPDLNIEGDPDVHGFLGLSREIRPGYKNIRVAIRLKSDASGEKIKELFNHVIETSPVTDIIRNPVPVDILLEE